VAIERRCIRVLADSFRVRPGVRGILRPGGPAEAIHADRVMTRRTAYGPIGPAVLNASSERI